MVKRFSLILTLFLSCAICLSAAGGAGKKNVIFVIADGAGPSVMGFLMQYARHAPASSYKGGPSALETLLDESVLGILSNTPVHTLVSDSAAAGTQMATGTVTNPLSLGVDAQGNSVPSLLEIAQTKGLATGLITDVYVTDATPAAFFAHEATRRNYEDLTLALLKTKPDVVLGGGMDYFMSRANLKDPRYQNIIAKMPYGDSLQPQLKNNEVFEQLLKSGYQLVFDKKGLASARGSKLMGLFAPVYLPFNIETKPNYPTLKEMSQKALEILSKKDKGFFLMIEAGVLDWALHNKDQGAALGELLELDETLAFLMDFVKKNPDTLLVLAADHDAGGFAFHYHGPPGVKIENADYVSKANLDIIAAQKKSTWELKKYYDKLPAKDKTPEKIQKLIKDNMAVELPLDFFEKTNNFDDIAAEVGRRLGVTWATTAHTASPLFAAFYGDTTGIRGGVLTGEQLNKIIAGFMGR